MVGVAPRLQWLRDFVNEKWLSSKVKPLRCISHGAGGRNACGGGGCGGGVDFNATNSRVISDFQRALLSPQHTNASILRFAAVVCQGSRVNKDPISLLQWGLPIDCKPVSSYSHGRR